MADQVLAVTVTGVENSASDAFKDQTQLAFLRQLVAELYRLRNEMDAMVTVFNAHNHTAGLEEENVSAPNGGTPAVEPESPIVMTAPASLTVTG